MDATARSLTSMLRRHARGVLSVLSQEISRAGEELAFDRLPETCLVRLSVQSEQAAVVELRPVAPQLETDEEEAFRRLGFKSRLLIEMKGTLATRKSNVVLVNGQEAYLDDADFVPFLRLALALFESDNAFSPAINFAWEQGWTAKQS